jgi:hypothetical protein
MYLASSRNSFSSLSREGGRLYEAFTGRADQGLDFTGVLRTRRLTGRTRD